MRIFLSFASAQRGVAERLKFALEEEGYDVFFDQSALHPGRAYNRIIRERLRRTDLLVFLISPESVESGAYALSELRIYEHFVPRPDGRVLPVLVEETPQPSIPSYLTAVTIRRPDGDVVPEATLWVKELSEAYVPGERKQIWWRRALFIGLPALVLTLGLAVWLLRIGVTRPLPHGVELVPYPRVQVVATVPDDIFNAPRPAELAKLREDIQNHFISTAEKFAPCMEWVRAEPDQIPPDTRARIFVDLSKRQYGNYWRIAFSYRIAIANDPPSSLGSWVNTGIIAPLFWHPDDPDKWERERQVLLDRIAAQFGADQELGKHLDPDFISQIPIAHSIEVDPRAQRIIVPLEAKRLDLEPGTLLKLSLVASLCAPNPGRYRIGLSSDGDFRGKLRCQFDGVDHCRLTWSSDLAGRLATREPDSVKVYLADHHRHCRNPDNCPGSDNLYPHP